MIPVKICGITNVSDARLVAEAGASAVGLIFYAPSPRSVTVDQAVEIASVLPSDVAKVGVFVDEKPERVRSITDRVALDFVQLHGEESPDYCLEMKVPVIKAIRVGRNSGRSWEPYAVYAFLLDRYEPGRAGGTGKPFDWSHTPALPPSVPIILSGGLNPENVREGIQALQPAAVDVNSGVEMSPGKKDPKKIRALFRVLADLDRDNNLFHSWEYNHE